MFPEDVCIGHFLQTGPNTDADFTHATAIYKGTVNDPTTFPTPSRTHGSHHWAFERLLSASLVPLTAAAFVTSGSAYPVVDGLLGISLVVHSHIGVSFFLSIVAAWSGEESREDEYPLCNRRSYRPKFL